MAKLKSIALGLTFIGFSALNGCKTRGNESTLESRSESTYGLSNLSDITDPVITLSEGDVWKNTILPKKSFETFKAGIASIFSDSTYKGKVFFPKSCSVSPGYENTHRNSGAYLNYRSPNLWNRFFYVLNPNTILTGVRVNWPSDRIIESYDAISGRRVRGPTSIIPYRPQTEAQPSVSDFNKWDGSVVLFKSIDENSEIKIRYIVLGMVASISAVYSDSPDEPHLRFIPIQAITQNFSVDFGTLNRVGRGLKLIEISQNGSPNKKYECER